MVREHAAEDKKRREEADTLSRLLHWTATMDEVKHFQGGCTRSAVHATCRHSLLGR